MAKENPSACMSTLAAKICDEIASVFSRTGGPDPPALDLMVAEVTALKARNGRVFLYGVGREGLMMRALCMRLAHLGLSAYFVGDVTTPPIAAADLLVASAGTGGYPTVEAICAVGQSSGARVLLLTAQVEGGSCAAHATVVCRLPARTMAEEEPTVRPLLPMGSAYEGAMYVLFEMVVYKLGEEIGESPEAIRARHTNLL